MFTLLKTIFKTAKNLNFIKTVKKNVKNNKQYESGQKQLIFGGIPAGSNSDLLVLVLETNTLPKESQGTPYYIYFSFG